MSGYILATVNKRVGVRRMVLQININLIITNHWTKTKRGVGSEGADQTPV